MANNELVNTTCTQGGLVLTDKTVSIKPLVGTRLSTHWSVRASSLTGVRVTTNGLFSQVVFLTRDKRQLVADKVPTQDAQRIAALFGTPIQTAATHVTTHPTVPNAPVFWQNTPTLPGQQPPQQNIWQRYRSGSRQFQVGIGCGALIVVCAMCSIGLALASANSPTQPSASSINTPGQVAQQQATSVSTATPNPTATPKPQPTNTPPPPPPPTNTPAPQCNTGGAPANPWCYTFNNTGNLIYSPPGDFCSYFNCIASFWNNTNGYVDECNDGTYSHSGGVTGACSRHGGEMRPLYQP